MRCCRSGPTRHHHASQLSALPVTASHCLETKMRQTESVRCSQCSQCSQGFNHRQQEEEYWRGQQTGAARCHAIFRNSAVPALHQNFYQQISAEGERGKCYIAGAASNENFNPIEIKKIRYWKYNYHSTQYEEKVRKSLCSTDWPRTDLTNNNNHSPPPPWYQSPLKKGWKISLYNGSFSWHV